jgi:three-Cys-motif partner protein
VPPLRKDTFKWWQDRIKVLRGFEAEADALYAKTGVAYNVGPQAISKLALFEYYVNVYTSIIKLNFPKAIYVDLFAGSGLTRIKSTGDVVLGSALIADRIPKEGRKFDRMFLVESDPPSAEALRTLLPQAEVIEKDVNTVDWSEEIGSEWSDVPALVVADPEGMDLHWATIKPLLERWSDVIINFQVEGPMRVGSRAWKEPQYAPAMDRIYGSQTWRAIEDSTSDAALKLYVEGLEEYKDIVKWAKVKGRASFHYYVIFAVRKTKGGQGWLDAIDRGVKYVNEARPDLIESLLDVYHERTTTLDS